MKPPARRRGVTVGDDLPNGGGECEAVGYLRYTDLAGTEWQTHFRFQQNAAEQFSVTVTKLGKTTDLGEPHYTI